MKRTAKIGLLAGIVVFCIFSAFVQSWLTLRRQRSSPPSELYEVVRQQVRAFRAADMASAYRYASANLQERYSIETFSDFARSEYPGVMRAERVEFGPITFEARHALVPVYFFLSDGDVVPCVYSMVREETVWRIDGVRSLKRWPAGRPIPGLRS